MSGHSKWAKIKHQKASEDARKGKLFTKLGRELAVAAREGVDPDTNFALRLAIERARMANMPKDTIERAIKRGSGETKGKEFEEITYEGYGPHGTALMLEVLTDNRNRAVNAIRTLLSRHNGNLGETGCVAWLFEQKGFITIELNETEDPEERALSAIDAGADDVNIVDGAIEIYTASDNFQRVKEVLEGEGFHPTTAELSMIPKSFVQLDEKAALQIMRLVEELEELEDIRQVYSNIDIPDGIMAKYEMEK